MRTPNIRVFSQSFEQVYDPRSPSLEIDRTPIILPGNKRRHSQWGNPNKSSELLNKSVELQKTDTSSELPNKSVELQSDKSLELLNNTRSPPRLLESIPILSKTPDKKRHSLIGLLETNLDYQETDLDKVIQKQSPKSISTIKGDEKDDNQSLSKTPDPNQLIKEVLTVAEFEDISIVSEEIVSTVDNETIEFTKDLIEEGEKLVLENKKVDIILPAVAEFDKKLSNLIYEDKITIKSPKSPLNREGRMPLGVRDHNKSLPKLRVSDKPRSRIPVAKPNRPRGRVSNVQCENTPPRHEGMNKVGKSRWGTEDSLII